MYSPTREVTAIRSWSTATTDSLKLQKTLYSNKDPAQPKRKKRTKTKPNPPGIPMALRIKSSPFPWPMGPLLASPSPTLNPLPLPHSAPVTLAPCLRRLSRCRPPASSAVLPSLFFVTDLSSDITSVGGLTCLCDLKSLLPWSFYHVTLGLLTCLQFVSSARSHCATSPAPRTAPDKC